MTKTIDYFFSIGSPWAFIGLEPFAALAKEQGATIHPHVIPLIEENGGIYSRNRPEARRAYWIRDLKRWAALRGKVLNFDNRAALGSRTGRPDGGRSHRNGRGLAEAGSCASGSLLGSR
jgi:2-hydroxychromene-2-carboxylate isomerase